MAEKVEIEIPGIGKVEATNAATEATLIEIRDILEKSKKILEEQKKVQTKAAADAAKGGKAAAGGGGGGNSKEADAYYKSLNKAKKEAEDLAAANAAAAKRAKEFDSAVAASSKVLGVMGGSVSKLIGSFNSGTKLVADSLSQMANVGSDLNKAASTFSMIPVVGGALASAFGAVTGAATAVLKSYQDSASVGATFNGSVEQMKNAASGAGLTLDQFSGLIRSNANNLMLFGGTTEEGAKKFAVLSKEMTDSGAVTQLNKLGYSTQQVNDGTMKYIGMMGRSGALQTMSTKDIARESQAYMKDLDALAKVTGVSREEKQKEVDALQRNAKVQAALAGIQDPEQQRKMQAYILSFPQEAQGAIANMIATGNTTSEEAIKLQAMLPGVAKDTMQFGRTLQAGGKLSDEQMNAAKNRGIEEAKQSRKTNQALGQYADDFGQAYLTTTSIAAQGTDGLKKAQDEQAKTLKDGKLAATLEESQRSLAKFSNEFQMFLAQSGLLDVMMNGFKSLANFIMTTGIPMFEFMGDIISEIVLPALTMIGDFIVDYFLPAFFSVTDFISDNLAPILGIFAAIAIPAVIAALAVQAISVWTNVTAWIAANAAMLPVIIAFGAVAAIGVALVAGFFVLKGILNKFGIDMGVVSEGFKYFYSLIKTVGSYFLLAVNKILNLLPGVNRKKEIEEIEADIAAQEKERADLSQSIDDKRKANMDRNEAEQKAKDEKRAARDEKLAGRKHDREIKSVDDKEKREKDAEEAKKAEAGSVDMGDPLSMLKSFAKQQNSGLVEKDKDKEKKATSEGKPAAGPVSMKGNMVEGLGKVAAQFESGGKAGMVSSGHGDFGGKSYGAFQLSSKTGDVDKFLKSSGYADKFKGMAVGSKEFDAKWKELGEGDKDFAKAQQEHAKKTHYDPQMAKLQKSGMDLSGKGAGVQEAIMSTANQYGANSDVILKALKGKDTEKMSDKEIINAIQDYKAENVKTQFKSSSAAVQAGVSKRIEQERAALLGVDGPSGEKKDYTAGGKTSSEGGKTSSEGRTTTGGGATSDSSTPVSALQSLVKDGINPTIFAFQELVKKGLNPFTASVVKPVTGVSKEEAEKARAAAAAKDPRRMDTGTVPLKDSLSPNEQVVATGKTVGSGLAGSESVKAELAAQKEKEAQDKATALEKEQAANRAKLQAEEAMAMGGPMVQETKEDPITQLNTHMAELIRVSKQTLELNERQLSVQKGLSGDLFA